MTSILPKPPAQQRQTSRPNSASSSSVVTIQRAPSYASRTGPRPPVTGLRSQSPYEATPLPTNPSARTLSPETTKRRSSAFYARPDSGHGLREGVGNLNRWSQSTASSKGSASHNRRNSFSTRLSGSFGSFGGFGDRQTPPTNTVLTNKGRSPTKKSPPEASNTASSPPNQHPILPPIVTLTSLSQAVDAADSPSTATTVTPNTADMLAPSISRQPDYFGESWNPRSPSNLTTGMKRAAPSTSSRANLPSPIFVDQSTSPGTPPLDSVYSPRTAARLRHTDRRRTSQSGHHRHRDDAKKGSKSSGATEGESSASDNHTRIERVQKRKAPSQKAMLSKALQKAHHAVTLDQHSNYEGAMHAYQEACTLLQKVMIRSSGVEDRLKLDAVRNTYEARIVELRGTEHSYQSADGKALPQPPPDRDSRDSERLSIVTDTDEGDATVHNATAISSEHRQNGQAPKTKQTHVSMLAHVPPRRQSLQQIPPHKVEAKEARIPSQMQDQQPSRNTYLDSNITEAPLYFQNPIYREYLPPPLSPRRPLSPDPPSRDTMQSSTDPSVHSTLSDEFNESDSVRQNTGEHTSWLNTINESSGSSSSSVHSRRSSVGLRRKHIRAASGQTEAEFDAALDAAIETAYDDGFEPDDEEDDDEQLLNDPQYQYDVKQPFSEAMQNVELAKESVREAERETAIAQARDREKQRLQNARDSVDLGYGDEEDDEEERMLEEMTRDYILDESEYDVQTKSALPRQSDSSGFSGRTWGSIGSNPTSAGTSLSTVAETTTMPSMDTQLKDNPLPPPLHPPPSSALPPPPFLPIVPISSGIPPAQSGLTSRSPSLAASRNSSPGVQDRRLSGTKRKPLKIETNSKPPDVLRIETPRTQPPPVPSSMVSVAATEESLRSGLAIPESQQVLPSPAFRSATHSATLPSSRKGSSPMPGSDSTDVASSTASALTKVTSADSDTSVPSIPGSPARFGAKAATGLRKNFSSSSLRNKSLTVSVPDTMDNASNVSLSSMSSTPKQRKIPSPAVPVLPTPIDTNFVTKGQPMGSIYLFDNDIHSPNSPGSPNPLASNAPLSLEPCPELTLLRPFWFLRSIYQTIAHPRGGYISNKLFVPRDIWRVKNIKLKMVEEKVSSCDLLTAALLKLGKVDTLDADAMLDEMQSFEQVMEQVQSTLSKRLGNEVGVQGATQMFKGFGSMDEGAPTLEATLPKSASTNSKSYLSWRKIRSKNSGGHGVPPITTNTTSKDGSKEGPTMKSLPMTTMPNPRFPKRDVTQIQFLGPNPSYMGALARLCDAAQILDQITRQVEDPGLKHSSQTHVGLELSARHASEFFAFYICRFVFTDIGMMLDKFIKRGSEWVLA